MVPRQADRGAGVGHRHHQLQHTGRVGAAIAVVADEHSAASVGRRGRYAIGGELVAELAQQLTELGVTAVNVADDVERPVLARRSVHSGARCTSALSTSSGEPQHGHTPEAFALQSLE